MGYALPCVWVCFCTFHADRSLMVLILFLLFVALLAFVSSLVHLMYTCAQAHTSHIHTQLHIYYCCCCYYMHICGVIKLIYKYWMILVKEKSLFHFIRLFFIFIFFRNYSVACRMSDKWHDNVRGQHWLVYSFSHFAHLLICITWFMLGYRIISLCKSNICSKHQRHHYLSFVCDDVPSTYSYAIG